jgi:hypothetical protein
MRRLVRWTLVLILFGGGICAESWSTVLGQTSGAERAAALRVQLSDLQVRQSDLELRLQVVEENMKPEVIEHSLAAFGSVHPEELREQRRRQLESERNGIRAQLDQLSLSRTRLERSLTEAEAQAYHESAGIGVGEAKPQPRQSSGLQSAGSCSAVEAKEGKHTQKPSPHLTAVHFGVVIFTSTFLFPLKMRPPKTSSPASTITTNITSTATTPVLPPPSLSAI